MMPQTYKEHEITHIAKECPACKLKEENIRLCHIIKDQRILISDMKTLVKGYREVPV